MVGRAALVGRRDAPAAGQVVAGQALRRLQHLVERALKHDLAAALAGRRADLDQLVGRAEHRLLVLDDDDRVAAVAEPVDGLDQPVDVARVQSDRRLVQHVQHVDQAGAERGGQRDALGLAAAERARRAIERQVAQADRLQVARAAHRPARSIVPATVLLPLGPAPVAGQNRRASRIFRRRQLGDVPAADFARQGLRPQPVAAGTRGRGGSCASG